jgi:hypothetical protein
MTDQPNTHGSTPDDLTAYAQDSLCQSVQSHTGAESIVYQDYVFIHIDGIQFDIVSSILVSIPA